MLEKIVLHVKKISPSINLAGFFPGVRNCYRFFPPLASPALLSLTQNGFSICLKCHSRNLLIIRLTKTPEKKQCLTVLLTGFHIVCSVNQAKQVKRRSYFILVLCCCIHNYLCGFRIFWDIVYKIKKYITVGCIRFVCACCEVCMKSLVRCTRSLIS